MRGVDLTPADETVALLLLAAHQRNMRRRHIKRKLAGKSCCKGPPEICGQQDVHQSTAVKPDRQQSCNHQRQDGDGQEQQDMQLQGQDADDHTHRQNVLSRPSMPESDDSCRSASSIQQAADPQQDAASRDLNGSRQSQQQDGVRQQPSIQHAHDDSACEHSQHVQQQQQQQQQHLHDVQSAGSQVASPNENREEHSKQKQKQKQRPTLKDIRLPTGVDVEQGWGQGADTDDDSDVNYDDGDNGNVTVFEEGRGCGFPCVLTPSSMATELAPHLTQQQAAHIYLGRPLLNGTPDQDRYMACSMHDQAWVSLLADYRRDKLQKMRVGLWLHVELVNTPEVAYGKVVVHNKAVY